MSAKMVVITIPRSQIAHARIIRMTGINGNEKSVEVDGVKKKHC